MYCIIDSVPLGDSPWHSFTACYAGATPESNVPSWMGASYDVWCHNPLDVVWNLLSNLDFKDKSDYVLYREYDSGHWA